eukprot:2396087-Amphidinium_carterae.1
MYRSVLDREQLKAPAGVGVKYFLDTLRPYFIKNKQSVKRLCFPLPMLSGFEAPPRRPGHQPLDHSC